MTSACEAEKKQRYPQLLNDFRNEDPLEEKEVSCREKKGVLLKIPIRSVIGWAYASRRCRPLKQQKGGGKGRTKGKAQGVPRLNWAIGSWRLEKEKLVKMTCLVENR